MQDEHEGKHVPATGSNLQEDTNLMPGEEPEVPGTLFLSLFLLMVIFGFWLLAYFWVIDR